MAEREAHSPTWQIDRPAGQIQLPGPFVPLRFQLTFTPERYRNPDEVVDLKAQTGWRTAVTGRAYAEIPESRLLDEAFVNIPRWENSERRGDIGRGEASFYPLDRVLI